MDEYFCIYSEIDSEKNTLSREKRVLQFLTRESREAFAGFISVRRVDAHRVVGTIEAIALVDFAVSSGKMFRTNAVVVLMDGGVVTASAILTRVRSP